MIRRSSLRLFSTARRRLQNSKPDAKQIKPITKPSQESIDFVTKILEKPTWSITSLLPPSHPSSTSTSPPPDPSDLVTPARLHHLLRLSGLPPPKDKAEEDKMISELNDQLYFVNKMREVDVTGVEPLVAIRDEVEEKAITLEDVERAEREMEGMGPMGDVEWDPLREASEKVGRYFVVEGEMGEGENEEVVVSAEEVKKVGDLEIVESKSGKGV
ncbi:hypothetical protein TWF694_001933 [Orbilia ellipsospora]|uniref:Glutamyl-tRNA amidotransferase complex subunit Gta3 domain-containing protein n=1 Tax=Orbilia ellipsospora TaxID=2528407 RepID=A0AAV9X5D9_9PEZI